MKTNQSPWIHQLNHKRQTVSLNNDVDTDVAIVGAGIAGISTAFFILKHTSKKVALFDKGKMAHGATGHNAGQVVARFERPLTELVTEFGFEKTKTALHDLNSAWRLIDDMYTEAKLDILFSHTKGHRGFSTLYQVICALKDFEIELLSGLKNEFLISETAPFIDSIPNNMKHLYRLVSQDEILQKLETKDKQFQALVTDKAGCMNSALFCQEIVSYLLKKYSDRFVLYENTNILKLVLNRNNALLDADKYTIHTEKIVLCTNGFENIEIFNEGGLAIDKKFHHLVEGKVGYMSGYLDATDRGVSAIAYLTKDIDPAKDDPYFYLTRRPHEMGDKKHDLVCVGGPEIGIEDREEYLCDYDYPDKFQRDIDDFIKKEYYFGPREKIDYQFTWHGLMGYTPNRIRLIGEEPKNKVLLYNLGCNGIGIIPSIFGGRRIAKIIGGEKLQPSLFDPQG